MCINIRYLFFSFWFTSLCMTVFRTIHVSINGTTLFFLWLSNVNIPLYMCHIFIHSSADRHLSCFHIPAIVNSTAMKIGVHAYFWIMAFSGYMPKYRISGSCGRLTPSCLCVCVCLQNLHTVLHRGCTSLHSDLHCKSFLYFTFSLYIHSCVQEFLMMTILTVWDDTSL